MMFEQWFGSGLRLHGRRRRATMRIQNRCLQRSPLPVLAYTCRVVVGVAEWRADGPMQGLYNVFTLATYGGVWTQL